MPLASQIELPERYRVARHIASGGMATVWEAEDMLLGRVVAVKVLSAQYAADPGARERFQREARTAAQVSDQTHVVTIFDIGEHGDTAFIVMEYFAGGTVADKLREARDAGERIPRATALRWLREAADGIDVAHAAGIVHRDVKPANLLLDAQGRLAVADFGIARLADDTPMTQTGQVLGTAAYLSPEQALGRPVTPASDRYALAVVAYELLTGERLFSGGPPTAQAMQHAQATPPSASEVAEDLPPQLDGVLQRGLAKDPGERPATATELVDTIEGALTEQVKAEPTRPIPIVEPTAPTVRDPAPPPPPPPPPPPKRLRPSAPAPAPVAAAQRPVRKPPIPILVAILVVAAVIALVFALAGGNDDPNRTADSSRTTTSASAQEGESGQSSDEQGQSAPPAQAPPPAAASASSEDPVALNQRGFRLIGAGDYAAAVEPLRASVEGFRSAGRTDELDYAYALYNYGVALNRSGNPEAAVDVLRERLKYNNQRGTVQKELNDALAKLGQGGKKAKGEKDDE
jgi:serine/threonine protein kinase